MNASLRKQIYESMDLRSTEELSEIWQTNDRVEWSDEAFDVIGEVLRNRGVEPPAQNEPVLEHDDEPEDDTEGLTEQELKIIDDENPPDFYDPFQVIKFSKWLNIAAIVSVILAIASGLLSYQASRNIVSSFFVAVPNMNQNSFPVVFFTVLLVLFEIVVQFLMTYFPLKALAHILRILMEMEYNSRKPIAAQAVTYN